MRILRWLFVLAILAVVALGAAYYFAGNAAGPAITINQPSIIGQAGTIDVTVEAPDGALTSLQAEVEQDGRVFPVFELASAPPDAVTRDGERVRVTRPIGKTALPDLRSGTAVIRVAASRPVLRGLREASSEAAREVEVRLEPPRVAVLSSHHYINVGGSEMVVYRVTPADVESGVRVGDLTYPGFPGAGAGLADPAMNVAFFALRYDQDPATRIEVFARDAAGNEAQAQFDHRIFPKTFRQSRIEVDDAFLARVVPPIVQASPELNASGDDLLPAYLKINNDLRKTNDTAIAELAHKTAPQILWHGAFQPLGGAQVESGFADFRTYYYQGKEVDRQVHLGFDLAKTVNAPVLAANDGTVIYARDLGIYGNCVIIDHGMGVQSLYAHLSSFQVQEGRDVRKGDAIGASGQTGLAGGDHLHFSMLVNGQFVNATEWWDPHWIEDRILRKLREAGSTALPAARP